MTSIYTVLSNGASLINKEEFVRKLRGGVKLKEGPGRSNATANYELFLLASSDFY